MDFLDGAAVQDLIGHYGYAAIFVVVMMESAGIPMPGETILVSAAIYAGTRHALDIRWVIAAAAGGAILGDNIGFWVGREFGEPLLEKWGIWSGSMRASECWAGIFRPLWRIDRLLRTLRCAAPRFAALLAGANGLAPWRFLAFNAAGGIVWATVFGLGGTCSARAYDASPDRSAGPC